MSEVLDTSKNTLKAASLNSMTAAILLTKNNCSQFSRMVLPEAKLAFTKEIIFPQKLLSLTVDDAKSLLSAVSDASTRVNLSSYIVNGFCRKYAN